MSFVLLHLVLPVVAGAVVLAAGAWLRGSRVRRAAARFGTDGQAWLPVTAHGDQPYPARPSRAALVLAGGGARLEPLDGDPVETVLPAGPLEVARVRADRPIDGLPARPDHEPWVVVVATDGAGAALRLAVTEEEAGPLVDLLASAGHLAGPSAAVTRPRPRRWGRHLVPGWSVLLGVAAALGLVVVASTWWASEPVTAVVTGPADEYDYCPVTWSDPWDGRAHEAQISCWGEQPGETVDGLALAWPFRGEVFDLDSFPVLAALPFVLVLVAAGGPLWRRYQPAPGHRIWQLAPAWSVLLGLVAGAWTLAAVASWVAAVPVVATVTQPADEGYCTVVWEDPRDFADRDGEVSCGEEEAGDRISALAPDHPFRGAVFDRTTFPWWVGVGVALLAVAATGPLTRRLDPARRRVPQHRGATVAWSAPAEVADGLVLEDLSVAGVEPVLQARRQAEGWVAAAPPPDPRSREQALATPWWSVPLLRSLVASTLASSAGVVFVVGVSLLGGWSAWGGWLGTHGPTDVAVAQVERLDDGGFFFFPDDAEATFTTSTGVETAATVAWLGDETGTATVEHSIDDPTRARVVGAGDGTGRGMALSGLGVVGTLGWVGFLGVRATRRVRRLRGALAADATTFRYLLTRDDEDDFALLLLDGDRFAWALPLADQAAGRLPPHGRVDLHGTVEDEGHVVAVVDGVVWWPGGTLAVAEEGLVRYLVTGEDLDDGDDGDDGDGGDGGDAEDAEDAVP